jgi:hypothetical protein
MDWSLQIEKYTERDYEALGVLLTVTETRNQGNGDNC